MNFDLQQHGFSIIPGVMTCHECQAWIAALGPVSGAGRRDLLRNADVTSIAKSPRVLDLIRPHLPIDPVPVRAIYFDKSPEANWLVPWHQDLTLALRNREEVPGFGPWSVKDGVPHVQPPVEYLEKMLTIRLHFDDTDESNGALRVLPGSHRLGRLSASHIQELRAEKSDVLCPASKGDALLMRPLLLHASGRSTNPRHRRILHIEYAAFTLPPGLEWHSAA